MNDKIDDMVSDDIGSMETEVQGKGQKADGPSERCDIREEMRVPYKGHLRDAAGVIELERYMIGIRIGDQAKDDYQHAMDKRTVEIRTHPDALSGRVVRMPVGH
jgi:hypothetical protein